MNTQLQTEITNAGMSVALITAIISAKIIGTVTDATNNPLFQASLKLNGLNLLVQTDINGKYDFLRHHPR